MGWLGDGSHRGQGCQAWTAVRLPPRYPHRPQAPSEELDVRLWCDSLTTIFKLLQVFSKLWKHFSKTFHRLQQKLSFGNGENLIEISSHVIFGSVASVQTSRMRERQDRQTDGTASVLKAPSHYVGRGIWGVTILLLYFQHTFSIRLLNYFDNKNTLLNCY